MNKRVTVYLAGRDGYISLCADSVRIHGDMIYAYHTIYESATEEPCEELVGVFREEKVEALYATEQNGDKRG